MAFFKQGLIKGACSGLIGGGGCKGVGVGFRLWGLGFRV